MSEMHSEYTAKKNDLKPVQGPLQPAPEEWKPSAIAVAEVTIAGSEPPVRTVTREVTDKDFTTLWNRVVIMDRAMMELIDHYRRMVAALDESRQALEAKQARITSLEEQVARYRGEVVALGNKQSELDDRVNWLET